MNLCSEFELFNFYDKSRMVEYLDNKPDFGFVFIALLGVAQNKNKVKDNFAQMSRFSLPRKMSVVWNINLKIFFSILVLGSHGGHCPGIQGK